MPVTRAKVPEGDNSWEAQEAAQVEQDRLSHEAMVGQVQKLAAIEGLTFGIAAQVMLPAVRFGNSSYANGRRGSLLQDLQVARRLIDEVIEALRDEEDPA